MLVMTNADNPRDAQQAVDMGAEGIGLCRTEHMFFAEDRIKAVREMICARTVEEREAALAKVEPYRQGLPGAGHCQGRQHRPFHRSPLSL